MPRLTVLICTHDRVGLLEKTLASLDAVRRPSGWSVDVLVAANACSDGTHAFLEARERGASGADALPLAWFAEPRPGKSNALNSALPRIESDLIAFVDDDHRVDSAYFCAIVDAAGRHPEFELFCGRIVPDWDGHEPAWVHDQGPYRIYPLPVPRFDLGDEGLEVTPGLAIPGGGNLFLRGHLPRKVGGFSTDLGPTGHDLGGAEDLDWVLRAQRLGVRVRYVPEMIQYHYVDTTRFNTYYLMTKAYKRTASRIGLNTPSPGHGVPRYLYRKVAQYLMSALVSIGQARRRFYLVRTAAALGELSGHLHLRRLARGAK
jgi:GT2 family glycosyltransferase